LQRSCATKNNEPQNVLALCGSLLLLTGPAGLHHSARDQIIRFILALQPLGSQAPAGPFLAGYWITVLSSYLVFDAFSFFLLGRACATENVILRQAVFSDQSLDLTNSISEFSCALFLNLQVKGFFLGDEFLQSCNGSSSLKVFK